VRYYEKYILAVIMPYIIYPTINIYVRIVVKYIKVKDDV